MATGKRYYWMKLKESFMTSDTIDYFMGLPNGANYVVLYQMLCLKTINTGGRFERQIGAVLIPYDIEKIRRDTKWFSSDTIRVALNLYMQFGLIYTDENGVMVIANHKNLVGSETDYALQKSSQRRRNAKLPSAEGVDNVHSNVHENVHTDIRDKRVENRDKSLDTREQRSDDLSNNNDNNNPSDDAEKAVDEFSLRSGADLGSYLSITPKLRDQVKRVTKRIYKKACATEPTEVDESKVFAYTYDPETDRISNDRIYILTCAFYKAAERGQTGNWYYIESILSDMLNKGIKTKDAAVNYFYTKKGED